MNEKIKTYWAKVHELRRAMPVGERDGEEVEFGYKTQRMGEVFTCTDYGNIAKFIQEALDQKDKQAKKEKLEIIESVPIEDMLDVAWNPDIDDREILTKRILKDWKEKQKKLNKL